MGIIAAGQITVVDLSDAPVLNTFITASRPTTQTYSKDSRTYKPSYASTPQVLTLKVTKAGSTANIIDSISSLHWFVVDGPIKTEITSKDNSANEYISGAHNEILTTKLDIDLNKGSKRYEVMGIWPDPSTGLDVQFGGYIDLLLTQNGATGPQGPQGDTGNGIANTVITYGLSMSDTTEPATWSSEMPTLVKGMYLWTRTVIIYTNGSSTTSYQISYIAKDADATAEIDKAKQELLEKLETVRDESLEAVDEAKQQLVTVRDESLAAAEEAKQGLINVASELNTAKQDLADSVTAVNNKVDNAKEELTQAKQDLATVADDLSTAKQDFQNAVSAVDTKATNLQTDLSQAKQDLASQAQQLQEQATAQSELSNRVSSVEETANGTKTTVSELSKTVAQNGKDITSVTARTKVVEDDLAGTKTTLSQVKTTADSTSQKTATLETGLNGLSAKFETLKVGSRNYFKNSKSRKYYIDNTGTQDVRTFIDDEFWENDTRFTKDYVRMSFDIAFNPALPTDFVTNVHFGASPWYNCGGITFKGGTTALQHFDLKFNLSGAGDSYKTDNVFIRLNNTLPLNTAVSLENFNLYLSAVVEDYSSNEADLEQKVAEYKQNADQNYASLQTTVQNLDGTVQHNKTVADQTAQGFTTRIESLETYKDGETTRANQYFESAKTETARQLTAERTAIAKDYVAKSTYTSDVTGIRNDLTATTTTANTTKTNLANYQASNDRAVANLQTNLQTANGNISSLKTKVEAVPGQITSAVSSVESKIPTNVSTRNLILKSNDLANPHKQNGANTTVTSTDDYFILKSTGYTANTWGGMSWNMSVSEMKAGEEFSILMPVYIDSSVSLDDGFAFIIKNHTLNSSAYSYDIPTNKKNQWFNVAITFKAYKDVTFDSYPFFVCLVKNGLVRIKPPMLVRGNLIPSDYQPAFEDTKSDVTSLNTTLTQTADGLKQLSTKVTSQGNTITSHTNSIDSLTTGLNAKVSQTDFNTLSGRVTTAENNITAKANELSSKITSVEGKIPTSVGARNYIRNYGLTATGWTSHKSGWKFEIISDSTAKSGQYLKATCTTASTSSVSGFYKNLFDFSDGRFFGKQMTWAMDVKTSKNTKLNIGCEWGNAQANVNTTENWQRFSKTFKVATSSNQKAWIFYSSNWNVGDIVYIRDVQLEDGSIATSPVPAIEDAQSDIAKLSSEIKQTADGITLLATKTELNNAKTELQSGINTATNKANNAQSTANNNAQTISTHTTQISALNTGLQAKVSQTDFNTLSGRVTTAENNITAKANELSSKISSVEGKIPTSVGVRNLLIKTNQGKTNWSWIISSGGTTAENYDADGVNAVKLTRTSDASFTWHYIAYEGLIRKLIEPNTKYTLSFDVKPSVDVTFTASLQRGDSREPLTNGASMNKATANQWTKVTCVLTSKATLSDDLSQVVYLEGMPVAKGNWLIIKNIKLEEGVVSSDWQPAPEDAINQISSLSSELKQTKDGITLLATKTELNSAKNELQSGINTATNKANSNAQTISTHTNQISALNTGLQAKVSQSDFNTLSGRVTNAENSITAKANELSSKITSVEGKIPTNVSTRNLILKSNDFRNPHKQVGANTTVTSTNDYFVIKSTGYTANAWGGMSWNMSISKVKAGEEFSILMPVYIDSSVNLDSGFSFDIKNHPSNISAYGYGIPTNKKDQWFNVAITFKANKDVVFDTYPFYVYIVKNGLVRIKPPMLVRGKLIPSDWQPAPEDAINQISSLSSELKQTKDGITLLATKTELNNAKNDLQSGINTATNKANAAQNTANNAQNKANSNAQTISTHTNQISALNTGLQAKVSQSDFNTLSGRVTTAENNITAKANELSSKITSVEGKLPTSVSHRNLVQGTSSSWSPFVNISTNTNWCYRLATIKYGDSTGIRDGTTINIFVYLSADELTLGGPSPSIRIQGMVIDKNGNLTWTNWDKYHPFKSKWSSNLVSGNNYRIVKLSSKVTSESFSNINGFEIGIRIDGVQSGKFHHRALMVTTGDIFPDSWSPAPEDAINQINSVSSEFKQTTDSIKASVTSLDKSTVKNSSLTINADGIVMKAGKSTTDVANAIGSYFSVNQNAINLFSDKISVKGNMIVNGTITGDKIKANSVDVSKISGLDATYLRAKIETAMVDWLKGKTIVADNGATKFDLMNGYINFNSDTPAIRRVTPGIPTQFIKFLKSDINSVTTIGSNRDGSESSMNDSFAGIKITSSNLTEQTEIISDQIYFLTGASSGNRRGWHMSTISGNDSRQITLVPTGNVTKSSIYASEHFIGGRNGWVNLRDFINYINQCLGHLQNHTGRYDIWKPFEI